MRLESALPVVTALAFRIQHEYNALSTLPVRHTSPEGSQEDEVDMERGDKEFVIAELLKLAYNLDYADETGRRKMFALVRESHISTLSCCWRHAYRGCTGDMASEEALPDILVSKCLDVLRIISSSERDLFMLIVEIVHELRDAVKGADEVRRSFNHNTNPLHDRHLA